MTSLALYTALTVVACHGCAPKCPPPAPVCVVAPAPCPAPEPVCAPEPACAPKKCGLKIKLPKLSLFKKCHAQPACEPVVYAAPEPCTTCEAAPVYAAPQASPQAVPMSAPHMPAPQMMAPPAPHKAARRFAPGSIIVYRAN